jgi:hypothetical protein
MTREYITNRLEAMQRRYNVLEPALRRLIEKTDNPVTRIFYEDDAYDFRDTLQKLAERLSTQSPKISAYHLDRLEVKAVFYEMITQTDESE